MLKAFVFDLDGTLVNSELVHYQAWRRTLLAHGIGEFPWEDFYPYVGTSNERVAGDYIALAGLAMGVPELVLEKQRVYLQLLPEITLCSGVGDILAAYRGRMVLAVATSSHLREAMAILTAHRLADAFALVLGGDTVAHKKPHPEIYLEASARLGLAPRECVAFEDSGPGLQAAKEAGMYAVVVDNEFTRQHDFRRADAILGSLGEVDDALLARLAATQP
jgi:HAD superfamily hydrolase (TIGR01509 family)